MTNTATVRMHRIKGKYMKMGWLFYVKYRAEMGSTHQPEDKTYKIRKNWFVARVIYFLHLECMFRVNCIYKIKVK